MAAPRRIKPTEAELEILRVLWDAGPGTVRQVHESIQRQKSTSYNTTLKLLQIMHEKGMVVRDESQRPQIYRAAMPQRLMQKRLVGDFVQRVFGGSARKLVAAIASSDISKEELIEIRRLLSQAEEKRS